MADFAVPGTWVYDGSANANQSTYRVTGHTATENFLVIFDRKPLTAVNGNFTKPSYQMRVIRSFVDANGAPLSQKAVAKFSIDWPAGVTASKIKAMIAEIATFVSHAETQSDVVDDLDIPRG